MSFLAGDKPVSYSTSSDTSVITTSPDQSAQREILVSKLRAERERLAKQKALDEAAGRKELEGKQVVQAKAQADAEAEAKLKVLQEKELAMKRSEEEKHRAKLEEARRAAEAKAEEARRAAEAKLHEAHAKAEEARKVAEAKAKEERERRLKAEHERQEAEKQRLAEEQRRKVERVLAAAGGASVGVSVSLLAEVFRIIGGPTLVAGLLRTPGLVLGKTFRLVEWDLEASPMEANGVMLPLQVRAGQLTRQGLREAISKAYELDSPKRVKQFAHVFVANHRTFYVHLDSTSYLATLSNDSVIVWTQVSPSRLVMPQRSDHLPVKPGVGVALVNGRGAAGDRKSVTRLQASITQAVAYVAALSRRESSAVALAAQRAQPGGPSIAPSVPVAKGASFMTVDVAGRSSDSDGAEPEGESSVGILSRQESSRPDASLPVLAWSNVRHMQDAWADPTIAEAAARLEPIRPRLEAAVIAATMSADAAVIRLFEWFGEKDVFAFVSYACAHVRMSQAEALLRKGERLTPIADPLEG